MFLLLHLAGKLVSSSTLIAELSNYKLLDWRSQPNVFFSTLPSFNKPSWKILGAREKGLPNGLQHQLYTIAKKFFNYHSNDFVLTHLMLMGEKNTVEEKVKAIRNEIETVWLLCRWEAWDIFFLCHLDKVLISKLVCWPTERVFEMERGRRIKLCRSLFAYLQVNLKNFTKFQKVCFLYSSGSFSLSLSLSPHQLHSPKNSQQRAFISCA